METETNNDISYIITSSIENSGLITNNNNSNSLRMATDDEINIYDYGYAHDDLEYYNQEMQLYAHEQNLTNMINHHWLRSTEYQIAAGMQTYLPPILIVFGTLGNVLSFCVLRKSSKQCSVFYYMALYALTNTLNLYVACGLSWISHITQTPYIANIADWMCKIWQFVFNVMRYTSTWLVVAMAFDRFVYLCIPSKAHSLCSVFTAKVLSCFIIIILVVISIHAMWTYELIQSSCTIDNLRRDFQTVVWPWFAATMHTYLPIVMLIVFNVFIIINQVVQNARRYQNRNFSPVQEQLTIAVLVINITFLLLSLPTTILNLTMFLGPRSLLREPQSTAEIRLAMTICQFLMFILCSINFPLYFISLPMLRAELHTMITSFLKRKSSSQVSSSLCSNGNNKIESNGKLLKKKESSRSLECTLITQL